MPESEGAMSSTPYGESCSITSHAADRSAAAARGDRNAAIDHHSAITDHESAGRGK